MLNIYQTIYGLYDLAQVSRTLPPSSQPEKWLQQPSLVRCPLALPCFYCTNWYLLDDIRLVRFCEGLADIARAYPSQKNGSSSRTP